MISRLDVFEQIAGHYLFGSPTATGGADGCRCR